MANIKEMAFGDFYFKGINTLNFHVGSVIVSANIEARHISVMKILR